VGFGITHELIARPAAARGLGDAYANGLYQEAKTIDPWEGEDYEGTSVLAGVEVARRRGWIDGYYWCFSLKDVLLALSYKGPVVIGVPWYEGMKNTDKDGYIWPTGEILGGHCVCLNSVSVTSKDVGGPNSWGIKWGRAGSFRMTWAALEAALYKGGEAVTFVGRHRRERR
jgi:hypothetical protein